MKHYEASVLINATAEELFAYVDDHARFSSHMSQSSWLMGGGRMELSVDEGRGQKVGSHIRLSGKGFGMRLFLDEVVTRRDPPRGKTWETVGDLRLLVVGHYRMSIEIEPRDLSSLLRVAIDYDLPPRNAWLGRLFGKAYASWCVRQMIKGVQDQFTKQMQDKAYEGRGAPRPPAQISVVRRILPFILGLAGAGFLVLLYLGIVTWGQGWAHALELLGQDLALVAAIASGFGVQVGLYSYLRLVVHHGVRLAVPTAATGAGTGTSSVAMVACCLHHVTDVLPVLGLSGAAIFLNQYRMPFMVVGLVINTVGVAIMVRVVLQGRAHLQAMKEQASAGAI